jgi:hypothetical protein
MNAPRPAGRPKLGTPPLPTELLKRSCSRCGATYTKPNVEPWGRWSSRRYCSRDCYHKRKERAA